MQHIPGQINKIADSVLRFKEVCFRELAPNANQSPDDIPTWPVHAFTTASCSCTIMASPNQLTTPTNQD